MRLLSDLESDHDKNPVKASSSWRPTQSAEEFSQQATNETLIFRLLAWLFLLVSAGYIFVFLRSPLADQNVWILHIKGYVLFVSMHFVLAYLYGRVSDHIEIGPSLKTIQAKVPNERAVPIEIRICQQKTVTGADQGFMWVDDGTLFFKGRQTAFRINREDLPPATMMPRRERPDLGQRKFPKCLSVGVNGRSLTLKFKMLDPFEDFSTRRRTQQFEIDLATWILANETGSMESLLPPNTVHPALRRRGLLRLEPLFGSGMLVAINAILSVSIMSGYRPGNLQAMFNQVASVVHVGLLVFSLWMAVRAWRTTQVRESLAAQDRKLAL